VIFLPYMMGERSPIWHTNRRGVFFGLSLATPKRALIALSWKAPAFALRHNVEIAQRAGVSLSRDPVGRGGARALSLESNQGRTSWPAIVLPRTLVGAAFAVWYWLAWDWGSTRMSGSRCARWCNLKLATSLTRKTIPCTRNCTRSSEAFMRTCVYTFDKAAAINLP